MKIIYKNSVALKLMTLAAATRLEFSGFGFVERKDGDFYVYDVEVLNIGSEGFTQIDPAKIIKLLDRPDAAKMKLWFHRHPLGNGVPGKHNWSGVDDTTCTKEPLGGIPEIVRWSLAAVLTPRGWVGRLDNHLKQKTTHLEVYPQTDAYKLMDELTPKYEYPEDTLSLDEYERACDFFMMACDMADEYTQREIQKMGMTYDDLVEYFEVELEKQWTEHGMQISSTQDFYQQPSLDWEGLVLPPPSYSERWD